MTAVEPIEGEVIPLGVLAGPPAPESTAPALVTVSCDVCGDEFTGPEGGRNNADMQLGRHLWGKHRMRRGDVAPPAKAAKVPPRALPVDPPDARHPVLATIGAAADQVTGKGAPSPASIAKALGFGLSAASKSAAKWAVQSDPVVMAQEGEGAEKERAAIVAGLALSREDAQTLMAPIGRLLAPTQLNKKFGRQLVENSDVAEAIAVVADYGRLWFQYLQVRREHLQLLRQLRDQQGAGAAPAPMVPAPAAAPPPPAGAGVPATPPARGPLGGGRVAQPTYRTVPQ